MLEALERKRAPFRGHHGPVVSHAAKIPEGDGYPIPRRRLNTAPWAGVSTRRSPPNRCDHFTTLATLTLNVAACGTVCPARAAAMLPRLGQGWRPT